MNLLVQPFHKMASALSHRYLDLAAMEALRHVRLSPRGAAEGTFAGPHKSHYRGTAVEFADYREYSPGDDIRLVDWKVFARTDRHYVRLYDAERNLLTYLVVDKSASMDFDGALEKTPSKLEYAARLAAALLPRHSRRRRSRPLSGRRRAPPSSPAGRLLRTPQPRA